jgi:hypothetical protein
LADPKPTPISVTADELNDVVEKRQNPPAVLPPQFDSAQHKINQVLATLLPKKTEDTTPEGFFSHAKRVLSGSFDFLDPYGPSSHQILLITIP